MAPPILARPELLVLRIMVCHDATSETGANFRAEGESEFAKCD